MTLRLITADERLADGNNKVSAAVIGRHKIGKTSLVKTLDPVTTLFVNMEAGMKSVQDWTGTEVPIRSFTDAADMACLIGGANEGKFNGTWDGKQWVAQPKWYSSTHYNTVRQKYDGSINMDNYTTIFWDSITDLTTVGMQWAENQPEAFSERTGKKDIRGAYGLLGREMVELMKHVQHSKKNVIFVGGLDHRVDEFNREVWQLEADGNRTASMLPYIFDQIIVMSDFDYDPVTQAYSHNLGKGQYRVMCCKSPNPWGLPAGDRSGALDLLEPPDLGRLIQKINAPGRATLEQLQRTLPSQPAQ